MSLLGTPADRAARWRARLVVAFLLVVALGVGVGGTIVSAQEEDGSRTQPTLLPTTTEAGPSTTEAEAPTTTEAEAPTTTEAEPTTTTVRRTTTTVDDLEDLDDELDEVDDESTTTTEETTTTIRDLLVPGDGSAGAESTTTSTTAPPEQASSTTSGISEETMIWLIVAGLVAIALLIGLWTVRYWRQTRPTPVLPGPDDPTTVFPGK